MHRLMTAATAALIVATMASAGELGQDAAPLSVAKWIKGGPVQIEDGKTYVVEFWATWCPPCRKSIPHLTEVQKEYADKGVVVIGISAEDAETVAPFVEQQGDKMDYAVAVDDDRATSKAYMEAFGAGGIPHAFIVDKAGKICWQGHPMDDLEGALDRVLEGGMDFEAEARYAKAKKLGPVYVYLASEVAEADIMALVATRFLKYADGNAALLTEFAGAAAGQEGLPKAAYKTALEAVEAAGKLTEGEDDDIREIKAELERLLKNE